MMRLLTTHHPERSGMLKDFFHQHDIVVEWSSRVDHWDELRDPICVLEITIPDGTKALLFKMAADTF